jgi:hypothetical protein
MKYLYIYLREKRRNCERKSKPKERYRKNGKKKFKIHTKIGERKKGF